jgi:VanZ family protein
MSKAREVILRWFPVLLIMLIIFLFSAKPSSELPNFDVADRIVKKAGHMVGYALLALSCWRALGFLPGRNWVAWCLAILYAVTDELHQSFVPGRSPSIWDVMLFDNLGALISLGLFSLHKTQRSDSPGPIVEKANVKS